MSGWHQLKIEVTTSQIRFYVDNILSETEARPNAYGFDSVVIGADLTANGYTAYVDNMNLTWYAATPVIDAHPVAQSVCEGDTAQFGVSAYLSLIHI